MPENNIRSVKQNPFTPPATSPTELTTYIGTPPDGPKKVPVEHSLTRKYWPDPTELDSFNEAG
ncbi:hypothetical protein COM45_04055 [Corynebacterium accolens]|uniref:Uncharacterized protein n=1 Tax=Corynebacterium accolens TaxID=38284 RepID=A0A2A4ALZ9_9CORY|nr:hypothetical protein COM45_04055 [Corynebacterium accolens]